MDIQIPAGAAGSQLGIELFHMGRQWRFHRCEQGKNSSLNSSGCDTSFSSGIRLLYLRRK
jgi:hypothetical protein